MLPPPPSILPVEIDFFDDDEDFRTQFRHLFSNISSLGEYTTTCLERLVQEEEAFNARIDADPEFDESPTTFLTQPNVKRQLQQLYDAWCTHLITHMDEMCEIRFYSVDGRKFKDTNGMHVFFELTRINYLVYYPNLLEEMDNLSMYDESELSTEHYLMLYSLKRTTHPSFVAIVDTFDISALYDEKEEPDEEVEEMRAAMQDVWATPVMQYTQKQLQMVVLFLTQQLNDVPTRDPKVVDEYRKVFVVLWLRMAQLYTEFHSEDVLDDPKMRKGPFKTSEAADVNTCAPNQRFLAFCFFYMVELLRRFFYYDMLIKNSMHPRSVPNDALRVKLRERTKTWVSHLMESLAEDAFEDMYANNLPQAYAFVGDDNWFKFSVQGVHSRGACIAQLRPHLHKRFFSQDQVTPHSVVSTTRDAYVSRLFVLRAIDEHLKIQLSRVRFLNAAVVMNAGIEMSAFKLETNLVPVLLQVFSSFWPYDKGRVYVCDDIFEAVGVWFWLLQQRYGGQLYDCDVRSILPHIVPPTSLEEEEVQSIQLEEHFENFEF